MDDKNVLLNQLRIDRTADVESDGSARRWVLIGCSVVLVLGLGAGAYWFLTKPTGIRLRMPWPKRLLRGR
ncbi:MAG: hypothetical protein WDO68_13885 [Gammaproteobacteria bacterium]